MLFLFDPKTTENLVSYLTFQMLGLHIFDINVEI